MSYIEDNLRPGEVIVFFEKPENFKYSKKTLVLFVILVAFLFFISPDTAWFIGIILCISVFYTFFNEAHDEFAVTNRRIVIKDKVSTSEFLLEKIEGCDLIGQTVTLKGAGGTKIYVQKILDYKGFKDAVYDAIEMLKYPDEFSRWAQSRQKELNNEANLELVKNQEHKKINK
ncbi:hypothetical protein Megvenef_01665 [Candidatus Megaera venefica]|uniref:PH domain-containing protein n=1 Tax=Candidatus Megaera venefica TaxID=2055910 RepID=A0ABU5NEX7_9RICK|nr:hypothetical protein [Candidatus Megaera venefica]MEA0971681.1 hypothetical protein [Candidatus Megaera venefica]